MSASPRAPYTSLLDSQDPINLDASPRGSGRPSSGHDSAELSPRRGDTINAPAAQAPTRKRDRPGGSRAELAYSRKRATTACRLCRSRKVKCNNARPVCGNCETSRGNCVYEDNQDLSSFDPASIMILERLDKVLTRINQVESSTLSSIHASATVATTLPTSIPRDDYQAVSAGRPSHVQVPPEQGAREIHCEELHIPTSKTTANAVLQWPIFNNAYPPNYIADGVFIDEDRDEHNSATTAGHTSKHQYTRVAVLEEDNVLRLVRQFLELVHPKNPILDAELLWSYTESVVENGLRWDTSSCLVLLACSLGCIATPFANVRTQPEGSETSLQAQERDLQEGASYYNLAKRRLGLCETGVLACQCYFLAGIYNMYTMRPLAAWSHFQSATKAYHLHLQYQARRPAQLVGSPTETDHNRSIEQRLYWSCYKSECELRVEMNLPNSSLADVPSTHMHPSPPAAEDGASASPDDRTRTGLQKNLSTPQQREQTWYYYLTEITLRRIANRVLNTLYLDHHTAWTERTIMSMVDGANHFEQQLDDCYATLPAPLRMESSEPSTGELPFHVFSRMSQIKLSIYFPFLYFMIHASGNVHRNERVYSLANMAVSCSLQLVQGFATTHRHHGTWFQLQQITTSSLLVLGAVKSRNVYVPQSWKSSLELAMSRMQYWKDEGPGVARAIQVLEHLISTIDLDGLT